MRSVGHSTIASSIVWYSDVGVVCGGRVVIVQVVSASDGVVEFDCQRREGEW